MISGVVARYLLLVVLFSLSLPAVTAAPLDVACFPKGDDNIFHFHHILVDGNVLLRIQSGQDYAFDAVSWGDKRLLKQLQIRTTSGSLVIKRQPMYGWLSRVGCYLSFGQWDHACLALAPIQLSVTLPQLDSLSLRGRSQAFFNHFNAKRLAISLSDRSQLMHFEGHVRDLSIELAQHSKIRQLSILRHLQRLQLSLMQDASIHQLYLPQGGNQLDVNMANRSQVRHLYGSVQSIKLTQSGSSNFNGEGLLAEEINLLAGDTSNARVRVGQRLNARLTGSAHVSYLTQGRPQISLDQSPFSAVTSLSETSQSNS